MENENENNNEDININATVGDNVHNKVENDSVSSTLNSSLSGGNTNDVPRREENPFSLKHFLKRDASLSGSGCIATATITSSTATSAQGTTTTNLINHSKSTSNINGNNNNNISNINNNNNNTNNNVNENVSPSKSATTSSLHNNCVTGARPKIPQFQSVNTLTTESKMKRSPRFPSFDSQSSLNSEMNDDKTNGTNLYHSRSNNSFNTDYPPVLPTSTSNNSSFVQRSYSNYDIEKPILEILRQNSPNSNYSTNRQNNNTPIMYSNSSTSGNRNGPEFSSALPDFVQDHLVMEQWYNTLGIGNSPNSLSPGSVDFDHLPDFTVNDGGGRLNMPFDLTYNSESRNRNNSPTLPLDLPGNSNYPTIDNPLNFLTRRSDRRSPQLDLPPDLTENNAASNRLGDILQDIGGTESNKIQTLPDFLSDGPIHSSGRLADVTQDTPHNNSPDENPLHTTIARLTNENERLRCTISGNRQIMFEQAQRIAELEERAGPSKRFDTFDENLEKQRTAAAQSSANKLKQQVKQLTAEIEILRRENESLREEGAVGGVRSNVRLSRTQQISRNLNLAATNAEETIRQLLSGVDNLRFIASTIENMDRDITNKEDEFLSDSDEHDFTGPAL